jgi:hypothetical protein
MAISIRNSRLASVGLASIVAIGVIGIGSVALADEPDESVPSERPEGKQHAVRGHGLLENSGVTRDEVKEGAAADLTLGEIIDQYGDVSADEAKANAIAKLGTKLDEAVASEKMTQERADEIEANAPAMLDRLLATIPGQHKVDRPHARKILSIARNSLETVAEVLGTDAATLREQLAAGQTIADIAGDKTQAVIDALTDDADAAIDQAAADGKIPADKVDAANARATAAIEKLVNEGRPNKPADGFRQREGQHRMPFRSR